MAARESAICPMTSPSPSWLAPLLSLLGGEKVTAAAGVIVTHSGDKWSASHAPEAVVFAESTADVAAVLAFAHGRGIPVTTRGAGIGYVGGCVPVRGGIVALGDADEPDSRDPPGGRRGHCPARRDHPRLAGSRPRRRLGIPAGPGVA